MKNVKYNMPSKSKQPSSSVDEPQWVEEWVPLDSVVQHGPLQVRRRLDAKAINQYRDRTTAGSAPPPIKVGRVGEVLYLVDGWHRMEAGAVVTEDDVFDGGKRVRALVADMSQAQVRWEAAKVNMSHGVPLKAAEYRAVFRAFIGAKRHIKTDGRSMSYREMAAVIGKSHVTLRNWTKTDFPGLFRKIGGTEGGNREAGVSDLVVMSVEEEHRQEAHKALQAVVLHSQAVGSPEARWGILRGLVAAAEALRAAGVQEPAPEAF